MQKTLIGKDPDAGKDWGQEDKGATEDEMTGWHHQLNGLEFEQALWDSEGQGSLACCSPQGLKESDRTLQLNSKNKGTQGLRNHPEPCTHFTPEGCKAWSRPILLETMQAWQREGAGIEPRCKEPGKRALGEASVKAGSPLTKSIALAVSSSEHHGDNTLSQPAGRETARMKGDECKRTSANRKALFSYQC